MSTIVHRPHHGLHISPERLEGLRIAAATLLAIIALAVVATLLPVSHPTYAPRVLQTRIGQLHVGMTRDAVRHVMGAPTQQISFTRGSHNLIWVYQARAGEPVYQLSFTPTGLSSIWRQ